MRKSRRPNRYGLNKPKIKARIVYEEVKTKSRAGVEYTHNVPVLKKV